MLPRFREYERCSTTAIDAYLSPLLGRYLGRLGEASAAAGLPQPLVMQSSGGVAPAAEAARAGAWSVLSGPAGGAVGAGLLARASGDGNALGFDMGGTSCDVCVVEDGASGAPTRARSAAARSSCRWSTSTRSAPAAARSAGATPAAPCGSARARPAPSPGPPVTGAAAGEPTVTDANLLLGNLAADSRLAGGVALDAEAAGAAVDRLGAELGLDRTETAAGIVRVANQEMVRALRVVTVERGVDPRGFALLPFGGAGPMHAAAIAAELGIGTILCPRAGGVLSAFGLCASERRRDTARTVMLSGERAQRRADRRGGRRDDRRRPAPGWRAPRPELVYELRYAGQAFELPVPGPADPDPADLVERFERAHEERYGHRDPEGEVGPGRHPPGPGRDGPGAAAGGGGGRSPRAPLAPGLLRRGVGRDAGPARRAGRRHRRRGPGRLRAARGDPGPARPAGAPRSTSRHDRRAVPL